MLLVRHVVPGLAPYLLAILTGIDTMVLALTSDKKDDLLDDTPAVLGNADDGL